MEKMEELGARSSEYGGWDRTDQHNADIFSAWLLNNVVLCYLRKAQCFSYWRVQSVFLEAFHAHFSYIFQVATDYRLGCSEFKC